MIPWYDPVFTREQADYDLIARFDPNNEDVIYIGGIDLVKSVDAGQNWEQISVWVLTDAEENEGFTFTNEVHADQHVIEFFPGSSSQAIFGNDGGVYYSQNLNRASGRPSFIEKNNGYLVTQFYACNVNDFFEGDFFLAGSQDNGTQAFFDPGINDEFEWFGGDGGYCFFGMENQTSIFSTQFANAYSWNPAEGIFTEILDDDDSGRFINPMDFDPENGILVAAKDRDGLFIVAGADSPEPFVDSIEVSFGFTPYQVTISPTDKSFDNYTVYAAAFFETETRVYRIEDVFGGDPEVTDISGDQLPPAYCSSLQFGANDSIILATFSNYGVESVWLTNDEGQNWRNVQGNLPDFPVRWSLFDPFFPDKVYLATEIGVWFTNDINADEVVWESDNTGLPNVRVDMLRIRRADNLMLAATHGRGLYTSQLETPNCATFNITAEVNNVSCPGANDGSIALDVSGENAGVRYQWSTGATTDSITVPAGTYMVTVTDDFNCQVIDSFMVIEPESIESDFEFLIDINSTATAIPSGGTPPYTFEWSNGQSTATATQLSQGSYMVTITDENGCRNEFSVGVVTCAAMNLVFELENVTCSGGNDGQIELLTEGANGSVSYSWSTGDTIAQINSLAAGDYFVTVTDSLSCEVEGGISIEEPTEIVVSFQDSIGDNSITASTSGGIPPYSYLWSDGQTTPIATNLEPGTYSLTVTDSNGCENEFMTTLEVTSVVNLDLKNRINIFPNPVRTELNVLIEESSTINELKVYSLSGKLLLEKEVVSKQLKIDVSSFDSGYYLIRFLTDQEEFSMPFIKTK